MGLRRTSNRHFGLLLALALALLLVTVCADDPTPYWFGQFTLEFNETTYLLFTWKTTGTWYYDSSQLTEKIVRANGRGDRYCGSIHPLTDTPCTHLVKEGRRYLIFPELSECCMCCTSEAGCGVLSPTWLQNATFQGVESIRGIEAYKWLVMGLQPNYYYSTANVAQVPVELDQTPNDYMSLHHETFSPLPVDPSIFDVPSDCKPSCPLTSVCTIASAV